MTGLTYPDQPYRGLARYHAEDALLFTGRAGHVTACAQLVTQVRTRILLLHGQTGCGKSSFLRAGLIPMLEASRLGFLLLREPGDAPGQPDRPVFVRSGPDPLSSLAESLYGWLSQPVIAKTARGPCEYDLAEARLGASSCNEFVRICADPRRLMEAFNLIGDTLPSTLVIVLDQVEEVLTLSPPDSPARDRFFEFLKLFNALGSSGKLILALRKDHSGEFIGLAQLDNDVHADFKVYLLPELRPEEVREALLLPTSKVEIPGIGSPYEKYGFDFDPDVVDTIIDDLFETNRSGGAILPIMQIVCQDLYESVRHQPAPKTVDGSLYRPKGLKLCMMRHISKSLRRGAADAGIPASRLEEEERRWRRVLYGLVRYEGDGRVHTDVMSLSAFREAAKKESTSAPPDHMFKHLSQPQVLVLRRISIPTLDRSGDEPMCSLGHDVVGLGLAQMRIADALAERSAEVSRRRFRVGAAIAATAVVAGAATFFYNVNKTWTEKRAVVTKLLSDATGSYLDAADSAVDSATRAVALAGELGPFDRELRKNAEATLKTLNKALPTHSIPLDSSDSSDRVVLGRRTLLVSPPGFVSLRPDSGTIIRQGRPPVEIRQFESYESDGLVLADVSEPFENTTLILWRPPAAGLSAMRSHVALVRDGAVVSSLGIDRLFKAPDIVDAQRVLLTTILAGDAIVLISSIESRQTIRTLLVNPAVVGEQTGLHPDFVAGVEFETRTNPPSRPAVAPPPTGGQQFLAGRLWLEAHFPSAGAGVCKSSEPRVESLQFRSLRPSSDAGSGNNAETWKDYYMRVPSLRECRDDPDCGVTYAGGKNGDLIVFGLIGQPGDDMLNSYSENKAALPKAFVAIDGRTGAHEKVPYEEIVKARRTCRLWEPASAEPQDDKPPTFIDGVPGDLVFGYQRASSIQIVRRKPGLQPVCTEKIFMTGAAAQALVQPSIQWRFAPATNQLLALTAIDYASWDLGVYAGEPSEPAPDLVALACTAKTPDGATSGANSSTCRKP
jgi:hypothetical protein